MTLTGETPSTRSETRHTATLSTTNLIPTGLKFNPGMEGEIKIYRTIILPVVLYGCETWSLILRDERKLRVFENMLFLFFGQWHHMSFVDFVVLPPGHGRSVTDFWGWDAHEAQLRCPDDVWVVIEGDVVPGRALNLTSTNLPRPWLPRESSPSRKIPTVEQGIEPGTSWLVVRDSDH